MKNKITKIKTIYLIALFFALFFVSSFSHKASADTNDTMLGYWKFDGNGSDYSNDGNTGVLNGGATYSNNVPSGMMFPDAQSILFNGSSSYVSVANGTGVQPTSGLTFSMWMYLDAMPGSNTTIGGNYNPGNPNTGFQFIVGPSQTSFMIGNSSASFSVTLPVATWFHLAATWDGTTIKVFLDGALRTSTSFTGVINYSSTSFELGNFQGKLDDVRLYKRALSDSDEISDLASKKHTKATWQGTSSSNYSAYPNWNILAVPDPFTLVTISSSGTAPVFTQSEGMAGLTIQNGASLDISQQNLTMHDTASFSNYGNLILANQNTQLLTGFNNDINNGTVTLKLMNSTPVTGLKTGSSYNNLIISTGDASAHTLILGANLVINGYLTINNFGIVDASSFSISVKGNFSTGTSGQFSPGNSTVALTGTNQSILGSNTFWNLQKSASAVSTLYFDISKTQTILNSLSLQGASGYPLNLRSTTNGTQWNINSQGTETFAFLNLMDSNNTSGTPLIVAGNSVINSGNNTNWIFDTTPPAITLDTVASPNSDNTPVFTGIATDLYSTVYSVEYQADSYSGTWLQCPAQDGTFNQLTEVFSCVPSSALVDGSHTIYFRSSDYHANTTLSGDYPTKSITIDNTPPVRSNGSPSGTLNAGTTSTVLTLMTDENATCRYSTTTGTDYSAMTNDLTVTSGINHSASVSGLQDGTSYNYYVRCTDQNNNANTIDYTVNFSITSSSSGGSGGGSSSDEIDVNIKNPKSGAVITDKEYTFKADTNNTDSVKFYYQKSGSDEKKYLGEDDDDNDGLFSLKVNIEDEFDNGDYTLIAKAINGNNDKKDEVKFSVKLTYNEVQQSTSYVSPTPVEEIPADRNNGTIPIETAPQNILPQSFSLTANTVLLTDSDNDGISDIEEQQMGTDPNSSDSDQDGMTDEDEILNGTDPNQTGQNGSDKVNFEDAKTKGETKEENKVKTVEMIEKNGKKVLKFSGQSKPNSYVTIYIYSDDPIVVRVKTDANGNWNYEMDEGLEDGEHEVYVALTDSQGKIRAKGEPIKFIKTAEAISIIPFADAAPSNQSPVEKVKGNLLYLLIIISIFFIIIAIIVISFVVKREKKEGIIKPKLSS